MAAFPILLFAASLAVLGHAFAAANAEPAPPIREAKFELFVADPAESARFYAILGFEVAHEKGDGYTTLASGPVVVALSPLPAWLPLGWLGFLRGPPLGTEIVFYTARLAELHVALSEAGHEPGPIALQSWGDADFRVRDPDGYYVRLTGGSAIPR